ncbi:Rv3654c family TadE-like protein [Propionicimonas sp.]|uniref:Rv3654c family TadE-like protein n=1 Tax=Propionicimonas sp. TaxID=1955623 RepID=UPI0017D85927|nr:Rv3654c family TadE-like protein [Propionicimonas sp.]MBU3975540.1 pilus assembly protein TadE [Actinomycetota bacterium]MBA3020055.1 pilus assembly protein TadE [Propionicimonas sp.]MBU3986311.1 pilus assembly protein TadE [Actinomycetota bacterium]MBU4007880.1 pilus assembly protein TadE [Actinomycetota bacterium]MBU4064138.1 pilus assembly protein TadE [Actinomycetota bacterium]
MNRVGQRGERGAASLLVSAAVALAMVITAVGLLAGVFAAAQRDAANAADLAALSGASVYSRGGSACEVAARIAAENGAHLASCRVSGDSFDFVVAVSVDHRLALPLGLAPTVRASAEAGRLEPLQ